MKFLKFFQIHIFSDITYKISKNLLLKAGAQV